MGFPIYFYGDRARAVKNEPGLSGKVVLYDGMFQESLGESWETQLKMRDAAQKRLEQAYPGIKLHPFMQGSTMLETVNEANRHYRVNPLYSAYSRFGEDGSLIAGNLNRNGVLVDYHWRPGERHSDVGLLLQAELK